MPEADGPAEATKTNLGSYPLIKKILSADKKTKNKKQKTDIISIVLELSNNYIEKEAN